MGRHKPRERGVAPMILQAGEIVRLAHGIGEVLHVAFEFLPALGREARTHLEHFVVELAAQAHLVVAQVAHAHAGQPVGGEARGVVSIGSQSRDIQSVKSAARGNISRVGKSSRMAAVFTRVFAALGIVEELQRAEVPVGGKGRHRAETKVPSTTLRWGAASSLKKASLSASQPNQHGEQGAQRRLLIDKGIQVRQLDRQHPARGKRRQDQQVVNAGSFATMDQRKNAAKIAKNTTLVTTVSATATPRVRTSSGGQMDGHSLYRAISPTHVQGIAAGGGQPHVARARLQLLVCAVACQGWLGPHAPQGLPFLAVLRARQNVHVVVVGLGQGTANRARAAQSYSTKDRADKKREVTSVSHSSPSLLYSPSVSRFGFFTPWLRLGSAQRSGFAAPGRAVFPRAPWVRTRSPEREEWKEHFARR